MSSQHQAILAGALFAFVSSASLTLTPSYIIVWLLVPNPHTT